MKLFMFVSVLLILNYNNLHASQNSYNSKAEINKKVQKKDNSTNSKPNNIKHKILGPPANTEFLGC